MRKRLTLSKETLRTLDAQELSMVVGGGGDSHDNGHGKTGQHGSCNAKTKNKHDHSCNSCNSN
jgi:hypothetical protein